MEKMTKDEQSRLDRIEEKIDKLSDVIVSIARAEEKIVNLEKNVSCSLERLIDMEERMRDVEKKADDAQGRLRALSNFVWISITTIMGGIVALIFGKPN